MIRIAFGAFLLALPSALAFAAHKPTTFVSKKTTQLQMTTYSDPDQPRRYAAAQKENNQRYLDITTVYDPTYLKGKRVALTGANRGLGLAIAKELTAAGADLIAIVRSSSDELDALNPKELILGIDQTNDEQVASLKDKITGGPIDMLINNAGYFFPEEETLDNMHFGEELKMIDICAIGPLRTTTALYKGGFLKEGSKVIMITSQGGSITWRTTQNPEGGEYGHHMSKAAANMAGALLAQELKSKGIAVSISHPGFNKTEMTKNKGYECIWEIEGAVDPSVGAKRVLYEAGKVSMENTGRFVNCEDGLDIPW